MTITEKKEQILKDLSSLRAAYAFEASKEIKKYPDQESLESNWGNVDVIYTKSLKTARLIKVVEEDKLTDDTTEDYKAIIEELLEDSQVKYPEYVLGLRIAMCLITGAELEEERENFVKGSLTDVIPYAFATQSYLACIADNIKNCVLQYSNILLESNPFDNVEQTKGKVSAINSICNTICTALSLKKPQMLDEHIYNVKALAAEIAYFYPDEKEWNEAFIFVLSVFTKELDIHRILVHDYSFTIDELNTAENVADAIVEVAEELQDLYKDFEDDEDPDMEYYEMRHFEIKFLMNYLLSLI